MPTAPAEPVRRRREPARAARVSSDSQIDSNPHIRAMTRAPVFGPSGLFPRYGERSGVARLALGRKPARASSDSQIDSTPHIMPMAGAPISGHRTVSSSVRRPRTRAPEADPITGGIFGTRGGTLHVEGVVVHPSGRRQPPSAAAMSSDVGTDEAVAVGKRIADSLMEAAGRCHCSMRQRPVWPFGRERPLPAGSAGSATGMASDERRRVNQPPPQWRISRVTERRS